MQVISFMNMKGGVGKTTLAVNIAYGLAVFYGKKVLIVDADPQFNATQYLVEDDFYLNYLADPKRGTIHDIFSARKSAPISTLRPIARVPERGRTDTKNCILPIFAPRGVTGRLDMIPSTLALIEIEMSLRGTEKKLKNFIERKATNYDYVIIDCPPTISIFTQAAILASNKYLVPIKPDPLSVVGLPLLERWLEDFTEDNAITLSRVGMVFTMVRGPAPLRMKEVMAQLKEDRPGEVFSVEMSLADAVSKSVEKHLPVFMSAKSTKAAGQTRRLVQEFLRRTEV